MRVLFTAAVAVFFVVSIVFIYRNNIPLDLAPVYIAAQLFAEGNLDQVYWSAQAGPPAAWTERAAALGIHAENAFPYIYPPLWLAPLAPLTEHLDFQGFNMFLAAINAGALAGIAVLAHRLLGPRLPLAPWLLVSLLLVRASYPGLAALLLNQLHSLVAFLSLAALVAGARGRPVPAGALLAVAAAIKLYPALFAVCFLRPGQRRALASFALCGGALAGTSLMVAGLPMHLEMVRALAAKSGMVELAPVTMSLPTIFLHLHHLFGLPDAHPHADEDLRTVLSRSGALAVANYALIAGALAVLALMRLRSGRAARRHEAFSVVTLFSLLSPIAWVHYFVYAPIYVAATALSRESSVRTRVLSVLFVALSTTTAYELVAGTIGYRYYLLGLWGMLLALSAVLLAEPLTAPPRNRTAAPARW